MAKWTNAVITDQGKALMNKTMSGGTVTITKVKSGTGTVSLVDLRNQTKLVSEKQTLSVASIKSDNNVTSVTVILASDELQNSYNLQQIGFYANDPDNGEILYAIAQSEDSTVIPSKTEMPLYSINFRFYFAIENDTNLTVTVEDESFVTNRMLQEEAAKREYDDTEIIKILESHTGNKSNPHEVKANQIGLGNVDNTSDADKPISKTQQAEFDAINNNLDELKVSDVAGGKNLFNKNDVYDGYPDEYTGLPNGKTTYNQVTSGEIKVKPNTAYHKNKQNTSDYNCALFDSNHNFIKSVSSTDGIIYTTSNTSYIRVCLDKGSLSEYQLEEGTQETDYEPYIPSVKMLSEKTTQIDDNNILGWVVPEEMPIQNYVDSNGVFHQRVGRVKLSELDWTKSSNNDSLFYSRLDDFKKSLDYTNMVYCKKYYTSSSQSTAVNKNITGFVDADNVYPTKNWIYIKDETYTSDASGLKESLKGIYAYYELATEITTNVDGNEAVTKVNDSLSVIGKCKNIFKPTFYSGLYCIGSVDVDGKINISPTKSDVISIFATIKKCSFKAGKTYYIRVFNPYKIGYVSTYNNSDTSYSKVLFIISANNNWVYKYTPTEDIELQFLIYPNDKTVGINASCYISVSTTFAEEYLPYTGDGNTLSEDVAELKNDLETLQEDIPKKYLPLDGGGYINVSSDIKIGIGKDSSGKSTGISVFNSGVKVSNKSTKSAVELTANGSADFTGFSGKKVSLSAPAMDNDVNVSLPSKNGTLALTSDIPSMNITSDGKLELVFKNGSAIYTVTLTPDTVEEETILI